MDTNFACKNPHFDFYAGQLTRDIVFQKSCHAKTIHDLKMIRVALIFPRVDEIGTAHWGKLKNTREPPSVSKYSIQLSNCGVLKKQAKKIDGFWRKAKKYWLKTT